jgi:hypothetical protein
MGNSRNTLAKSPSVTQLETDDLQFPLNNHHTRFHRTPIPPSPSYTSHVFHAPMSQDDIVLLGRTESFSVELLRMILCALTDISTLHSAVLLCPTLYQAFWDAESSITTAVLCNQIGVNLLQHAVVAFAFSNLSSHLAEADISDAQDDMKSFVGGAQLTPRGEEGAGDHEAARSLIIT